MIFLKFLRFPGDQRRNPLSLQLHLQLHLQLQSKVSANTVSYLHHVPSVSLHFSLVCSFLHLCLLIPEYKSLDVNINHDQKTELDGNILKNLKKRSLKWVLQLHLDERNLQLHQVTFIILLLFSLFVILESLLTHTFNS